MHFPPRQPGLARAPRAAGLVLRSRRGEAGFTLIELLTVIAIIGILAAIVIPTVGSVRDKAQRAVDQTNIREIAKAATIYAQDNNDSLPEPQSVLATTMTAGQRALLWPGVIARNGILTDPKLYFSKLDPSFTGIYPQSIINQNDVNKRSLDTTFLNRSLSYEFVGNLRTSDPATTPVVFTRGLQTSGLWNINSGVYKDTGGYIAFLGGNVEWFPNTNTPTPGIFTSNATPRKTANILQSIPFTPRQARVYGIPPAGSAILGNPGTGTAAVRGN